MAALSHCAVTEELRFESAASSPPLVRSAAGAREQGTALGEIVFLDLATSQAPGAELRPEALTFPLLVRDDNRDQRLAWRLFVDFDSDFPQAPQNGSVIEPTGEVERPLDVVVGFDVFRNGAGQCHKVEVLISGAFVPDFPFREPVEEGDLATAVWWIHVTDDTQLSVDMRTCP